MLLLLFYIHHHFMVFKNEHNPYPKMSVKWLVSCCWVWNGSCPAVECEMARVLLLSVKWLVFCCWVVLFTSVDNVTFISAERPNKVVVVEDIVIGDRNHISKGPISKELPPRSCPKDTNGKSSNVRGRKQDFTSQVEFVAICLHLALFSKWK